MHQKGRKKKSEGAVKAATLKKRSKKTASKELPPVSSPQAIKWSSDLNDDDSGRQAVDRDGLDGLMDILINISTHLDATDLLEVLKAYRETRRSTSSSISQQMT